MDCKSISTTIVMSSLEISRASGVQISWLRIAQAGDFLFDFGDCLVVACLVFVGVVIESAVAISSNDWSCFEAKWTIVSANEHRLSQL